MLPPPHDHRLLRTAYKRTYVLTPFARPRTDRLPPHLGARLGAYSTHAGDRFVRFEQQGALGGGDVRVVEAIERRRAAAYPTDKTLHGLYATTGRFTQFPTLRWHSMSASDGALHRRARGDAKPALSAASASSSSSGVSSSSSASASSSSSRAERAASLPRTTRSPSATRGGGAPRSKPVGAAARPRAPLPQCLIELSHRLPPTPGWAVTDPQRILHMVGSLPLPPRPQVFSSGKRGAPPQQRPGVGGGYGAPPPAQRRRTQGAFGGGGVY